MCKEFDAMGNCNICQMPKQPIYRTGFQTSGVVIPCMVARVKGNVLILTPRNHGRTALKKLIDNNSRIVSKSIGKKIQGKKANLIIMDDILDDKPPLSK